MMCSVWKTVREGRQMSLKCTLTLVMHHPKAQPVRQITFAVHQEVAQQLHEMEENGINQPSNSPWASPIVLVKGPLT